MFCFGLSGKSCKPGRKHWLFQLHGHANYRKTKVGELLTLDFMSSEESDEEGGACVLAVALMGVAS